MKEIGKHKKKKRYCRIEFKDTKERERERQVLRKKERKQEKEKM